MKKEARILLTGRVQGVGLRFAVFTKANELKLAGWIKNMPDNSVELLLQGHDKSINGLINWLKALLDSPNINKISVNWLPMSKKFEHFSILY